MKSGERAKKYKGDCTLCDITVDGPEQACYHCIRRETRYVGKKKTIIYKQWRFGQTGRMYNLNF